MLGIRTGATVIGIMLLCHAAEPCHAGPERKKGDSEPTVTIVKAIQSAVTRVPGRVHEINIIRKKDTLVWEVEVITPEGHHMIVDVDGNTGAVNHIEEKSIEKISGDPTKGKLVYESHCLSCHGSDGKGTGPMGPLLTPPATDFTSEATRGKSDADLLHTIQEGRSGTAMVDFKRSLSKQAMRDVLAYVRALSRGQMN